MILPIAIGFVVGRIVGRKSIAILSALLIGSVVGLIASYTLIPLLYPIFSGNAGLVVIPEFYSMGIMILHPDFVVYTETVYMMTRSQFIDLVFVLTGAIFSLIGAWGNSSNYSRKVVVPFEEIG
jgi:hypothetical protein